MEKRIRLQRLADHGSFVQEMAGDKVVNSIFLMTRNEAAQLFMDLNSRYGFIDQMFDKFPTDLFREAGI